MNPFSRKILGLRGPVSGRIHTSEFPLRVQNRILWPSGDQASTYLVTSDARSTSSRAFASVPRWWMSKKTFSRTENAMWRPSGAHIGSV